MTGQTLKIPYDDWMKATDVRMSRRSSAMKKLDTEIKNYETGIKDFYNNATPYQQMSLLQGNTVGIKYTETWHQAEIKIALDLWKNAKGPTWATSSRNKSGAISNLDNVMRHVASNRRFGPKPPDERFAANARQGILHFLSHARTIGMPQDPVSLLKDASFASADVHHVYSMANDPEFTPAKIAIDCVKGETSATGGSNRVNNIGALNVLYNEVANWLRANIDGEALISLLNSLPRIIGEVFSGVASQLGGIINIGKNIKSAVSAYGTYRHKSELEAGILSGHPKQIVSSVHDQIRGTIKDGAKGVLKQALLIGLDVAMVGASTVLKAFMGVIEFVYALYTRFKETRKLRKAFEDARTKKDIYRDASAFQKWFADIIKDLPIISCYCMSMPLTGSYFGFLAATSTNNSSFSFAQLERNNMLFDDMKNSGRNFIADHGIKILSDDPMVAMSLNVAQGNSLSIGDFENENAAKQGLKRYAKMAGFDLGVAAVETTGKNARFGWW